MKELMRTIKSLHLVYFNLTYKINKVKLVYTFQVAFKLKKRKVIDVVLQISFAMIHQII